MPELPEVETIARKLDQALKNKQILRISVLHPKSWQGLNTDSFVNLQVDQVSRNAKLLKITLKSQEPNSPTLFLLIHLKMTGQLIYIDQDKKVGGGHPTADWILQLPGKHTRAVFEFTDNSRLFFNDQRIFGWIKAVSKSELETHLGHLSPDIIDPLITPEYFKQKIARRSQSIKQVLMDNSVASGVGNIYACDALNVAHLHPMRPANSLTPTEIEQLVIAAKEVINQGIELGGTTFDGKYVDISGMAGKYQNAVRVYGKEGKECPNCGEIITKMKIGGRGTYFCPKCQR